MTGQIADLFMGSVSVVIGAVLLLAGLLNWERAFQFRKTQWIESRWGRPTARAILIIAGAGLLALGVVIAMGFAPNAG
jgi:uncharacterized membrane protein YphA (DoxX/SURF4 family)